MPDDGQQVCLGVVIGPHGIKGEVNIRSYSGAPDGIAAYGPLTDENGNVFEVAGLRQGPKGPVVRFAGIDDRSSAEALKGIRLLVRRDQLPDLEADEYYHSDLVGLRVENKGEFVGTVAAVHNFGAGDLSEVDRADRASVILTFTREVVPLVDIAGGVLAVDPPPGYLDEGIGD